MARTNSTGAVAVPGVYRISRIDQSKCPIPLTNSSTIQNQVTVTSNGERRRAGESQHHIQRPQVQR